MAARRGRKKARRRRDTRFNVLNFVESVFYGNLITGYVFGTNLIGFFTDKPSAAGEGLQDIVANPEASFEHIQSRLGDTSRLVNVIIKAGLAAVTFKFINKSLAMPRRKVNAGLKQLGVPVKL